jgi:hypothetical protein
MRFIPTFCGIVYPHAMPVLDVDKSLASGTTVSHWGCERSVVVKTKDLVLWGFIAFLFVLPLVTLYFQGGRHEIEWEERPEYIPITEILPVHKQRIKDRIALLKKQSLDETFEYLLDNQQYHVPGYHPAALFAPVDIESILSTRSSLKVFQEFDSLPREEAIKKLHEFCKRAIRDFRTSLERTHYDSTPGEDYLDRYRQGKESVPTPLPSGTITSKGSRYMLYVSMLLAARLGEIELLINQIEETQHLVDVHIDRVNKDDTFPTPLRQLIAQITPLEDDALLTVLMLALKRTDKDTSIPLEESFVFGRKPIPLCRWDAPLIHYDFEVIRMIKRPDPQDVVEQFIVYEFPQKRNFGRQEKRFVINALKERLAE